MIDITLFLFLIFLSGFFSSAETAFFSLSQAQARLLSQGTAWRDRVVWQLKAKPEELLTSILIGNNIVNILTASYATVVATRFFGDAALGIATGLTTFFILVFGEIVPKSLAYSNNVIIARFAAPVLYGLRWTLYPVVRTLTLFSAYLQQQFARGESGGKVTEEEVRMMARMSVENGEMHYREREMIENVFRFDDIAVREVMTPRYKMTVLNGMVPVEQIAYFVGQNGHSRYPVYVGDEDNIIGYIHVNTLLRVLKSDERHRLLKEFVDAIPAVPASHKIERIFRAMKRDKIHMYLVHRDDDSTEVIGLVTLEDILEEIVGEISDETDERSVEAGRDF